MSRTRTEHTYDAFNQLITSTTANGVQTNTYDGQGLRVAASVPGEGVIRYVYEYDKVILETDGNGAQTGRNIYGTNLLVREADGSRYYYRYNGHGDVTGLVDAATGAYAATYTYDAFGNILEQTGTASNSVTYAGYTYDKETGLYYLNARMYDPATARFLQEDTYGGDTGDPLSLNRYTYCSNNPIRYWDPTGHWQVGDETKSIDVQATLMKLTAQWLKATSESEKVRIHELANDYRADRIKPTENFAQSELLGYINVVMSKTLSSSKITRVKKSMLDSDMGEFFKGSNDSRRGILSNVNQNVLYNRYLQDYLSTLPNRSEAQYDFDTDINFEIALRVIYGVYNDNSFADHMYNTLPGIVRDKIDFWAEDNQVLKHSNPNLYDTKYADAVLNMYDAVIDEIDTVDALNLAVESRNPTYIVAALMFAGGVTGNKTKFKTGNATRGKIKTTEVVGDA